MDDDPKPSLAIVVKYYPPTRRISGIIGYIAALTKHLKRHFDVTVVTYGSPLTWRSILSTPTCRVIRIGSPFPLRAGRTVRSLDPDVTLVVSGLHEPWLFVPHWGLFEMAAGTVTPRHLYQVTLPKHPPPELFSRVLDRYTSVLCASAVIADSLADLTSVTPAVLPPAVDVTELGRTKPSSKRGRFRVGFVNHLNHLKGFDRVLTIFRGWAGDEPDLELVIAGTGELADEAQTAAEVDQRITLMGYLDDTSRLALMASCDVMLLPFRTGVSVLGLSQTVLECLALGTVVVGSATPSISPAIRDGTNGLLFHSDAEARDHLSTLSTDRRRLAAMEDAARESAIEFDVRERAKTFAAMLGGQDP